LDFYSQIIKPLWEEEMQGDKNFLTYEMLMWKYEETTEETINRNTIRETYLKPLEQKGLIDFQEDPQDKRKKT
jgi:tRNA(Ile)-lysidine synthase TilS/MesJ